MEQHTAHVKCRKCRFLLFQDNSILYKDNSKVNDEISIGDRAVWHLNGTQIPPWLSDQFEENNSVKGKIICPKCKHKIGGFDFIAKSSSEYEKEIWITKNRVDLGTSVPHGVKTHIMERANPSRPIVSRQNGKPVLVCPHAISNCCEHCTFEHRPSGTNNDGHKMHMFDTNCDTCRNEFISSQKDYDFRGPVSHGNHIFDTSCDVCRSEFVADQHLHFSHVEFQGNDDIKIDAIPCQDIVNASTTSNVLPVSVVSKTPNSNLELQLESQNVPDETPNSVNVIDNHVESGRIEMIETASSLSNDTPSFVASTELEYVEGVSHENRFALIANPEEEEEDEKDVSDHEERGAVQPASQAAPSSDLDMEAVTCSVCLELYYLPHWCEPCQHVFCGPCLRRIRASAAVNTKCPLCRQVIVKCLPQHELSKIIKALFPNEHKARRTAEKKVRHQLAPLPGVPMPGSFYTMNRNRRGTGGRGYSGGAQVLMAGAGVCFVVLLMMLGFTVFATTVGFVLWYLVEVSMDIVCELAVEFNDFFDLTYQALVLLCMDGKVPTELYQLITSSVGRMGGAFTKLVNRTMNVWQQQHNQGDSSSSNDDSSGSAPRGMDFMAPPTAGASTLGGGDQGGVNGSNASDSSTQFLNRMAQAQVANYVLLGFMVTYLLYRFARHLQARRVQMR